MRLKTAIVSVSLLAPVAIATYFFWQDFSHKRALSNLAERTRAEMIYVRGATFMAGNYQTLIKMPDGEVMKRWVVSLSEALPPYQVTLASYYLQANETTNQDFELFLIEQGLPQTDKRTRNWKEWPQHGARIAWDEARDYCAWLGKLSGFPLRLPTEAEWEFAARSRGQLPPWATNNGEAIKGVNVIPSEQDTLYDPDAPYDPFDPPIGTFPPNPMGFYDMAEGLYEWMAAPTAANDENVRISKGGENHFGSAFGHPIPTRAEIKPIPLEKIRSEPLLSVSNIDQRALARNIDPVYMFANTARCVAPVPEPPAVSGFGILPDLEGIDLSGPFGPYTYQGKYLGD